ncbi:MAG: sulfotransferase [Candidatus Woesearchaeota archaeon]
MSNKIKVIYIVGSGHCGSTLLDLIIGSSPEVFSVGELAFYNIYRNNEKYNKNSTNYICTCKKNFNECAFWKKINNKGHFKIKKRFSLIEDIKITFNILFGVKEKRVTDDSFRLLREILREGRNTKEGIKYILDSSKDPRRLYHLFNEPRIELFPIFLIRDGRKVAHSYNRIKPGKDVIKRKNKIITYIFRWWFVNLLSKKLIKNNKKAITIRYEDFCQNPEKYIKLINKKLVINIDEKNYLKKVNSQTYHNIDGNELRFKKIKEIRKR